MENQKYVDKCLEHCSGSRNSKFHMIFGTLMALMFGSTGLFIYGFGFFELDPKLICTNPKTLDKFSCSKVQACNGQFTYEINFEETDTLHNWVTDLNLVCLPHDEIGLIGSLLLFGFFIGSIFLVRLGDIHGRKPIISIALCCSSLVLIMITQAASLEMLYVGVFMFGVCMPPQVFLIYILLLELTTPEYQSLYSSMTMVFDGVAMILLGVYFYFFKSMYPIVYFLAGFQIFALYVFRIYIPESPKFHFDKKNLVSMEASLKTIATFNGIEFDNRELVQFAEPSSTSTLEMPKYGLKNLVQNKSYMLNSFALAVAWSTSVYSFYFIEFYMKNVPIQNIYLLAVLIGISDIIAAQVFKFLLDHVPSKFIILGSYIILSILASTLTLLIDFTDSNSDNQVILTILIFGMRFFSSLSFVAVYFVNTEYFPPLLKGCIFSMTNVCSRLAAIFSPMMAEVIPNPAVTVAIAALLASGASTLLSK